MRKKWFFLLIFSLVMVSCTDFNKVVKSTDYEYKYKKGIEYYEMGDYNHANTLFQDLVYVFRELHGVISFFTIIQKVYSNKAIIF